MAWKLVPRRSQCPRRISLLGVNSSAVAAEVRVLPVLRGDAQGHLLAASGDPERDALLLHRQRSHDRALDLEVAAIEGRRALRPGLPHDLHALIEHAQPVADLGEAVAVGVPLVLVPAAADAHLDAAARHVVDRGCDLREVRGVAVAHARAHLAEAHALGDGAEGRHEGPGLVRRLVARHGDGVEVVVDPDRLPRPAIGVLREALHHRPLLGRVDVDEVVAPALGDEESESHGPHATPAVHPFGQRARRASRGRPSLRRPRASRARHPAG